MAKQLKAKLSLVSVGLAETGHCLELKVTKPQSNHKTQPDMDAFLDGLKFLKKQRIENQRRKDSDLEDFQISGKLKMSASEQLSPIRSESPKQM